MRNRKSQKGKIGLNELSGNLKGKPVLEMSMSTQFIIYNTIVNH
jgi:hypothetical protein